MGTEQERVEHQSPDLVFAMSEGAQLGDRVSLAWEMAKLISAHSLELLLLEPLVVKASG